ncbi:S49 family peptidase [Salinisphaera hydrothermalis]|uniref:S49 family peptidase n=1 Tax=Salinisphaera hydrothermalis TaxID=563188 RepID=UPI003341000F
MFPALVHPAHFHSLASFKEQPTPAAMQSGQAGGQAIVHTVAGIAIVSVAGVTVHRNGAIHPTGGTSSYEGLQIQIQMALDNPDVRGIMLDLNSGGGEVAGLFDLVDLIYEGRAQKPIWALIDETGASAAYALASAAHRIVMPRTAQAGSIGVVLGHVDMSSAMEKAGLSVTLIHAGARKVDGNQFAPLSAEAKARLQAEVDQLYSLLTSTVARNRAISESAVRNTQAALFTGQHAVKAGLADEVMASHDALQAFYDHLNGQRRPAAPRAHAQQAAAPVSAERPAFRSLAAKVYGS